MSSELVNHFVGFQGDDAKREFVSRVAKQIESGECPPLSDIIKTIDSLPFAGRVSFLLDVVIKANQELRDSIIKQLFDCCFITEDSDASDDEFVVVGCGGTTSLNTRRYYMMRILVIAIPQCGQLSIDLFEKYEKSSSTTFRNQFLVVMVRCKQFPDDHLKKLYLEAIKTGKDAIRSECKSQSFRKDFLAMMVNEGHMHKSALFHSHSKIVREELFGTAGDEFMNMNLMNVKDHCDVYFEYLIHNFKQQPNPLERGKFLRYFESKLGARLSAEQQQKLLSICCEYRPLELIPGQHQSVCEYLQKAAENGEDLSAYEAIQIAIPSDIGFLSKSLPQYVFPHLVITDDGCRVDAAHSRVAWSILELFFKKRLAKDSDFNNALSIMKQCFENVSKSVFENFVFKLDVNDNRPEAKLFKFLITKIDLVRGRNQYRCITKSWIELHMKYGIENCDDSEKVSEWCESYLEIIEPPMSTMAANIPKRLTTHSKTDALTGITVAVGWYRILLEHAWEGVRFESFENQVKIFKRLTSTSDKFITHEGITAVDLLRDVIFKMLVNDILPQLKDYLQFSRHNSNNYISQSRLSIASMLTNLVSTTALQRPEIRDEHYKLLLHWSTNCVIEKEFYAYTGKCGKKLFAHYNVSLHKSTETLCETELLRHMRCVKKEDFDVKVWELYRKITFEGDYVHQYKKTTRLAAIQIDASLTSIRDKYLAACAILPQEILKTELPTIKIICKMLIREKQFSAAARAAKLFNILEEVTSTMDDNNSSFLETYGNIFIKEYKDKVLKMTTDRDMHVRISGHAEYLSQSLPRIMDFAEALSYTSNRIKNEAGLTRPNIYNWLGNNCKTIVCSTLCLKLTSEERISSIETISKMFEKLIKDDVSKRDSVGKNKFLDIANLIAKTVLTFDLNEKFKTERLLWLQCSYRITFTVEKAITGEESWMKFNWPGLNNNITAPMTNWITENDIRKGVKTTLTNECGGYQWDNIRAVSYSKELLEIKPYHGLSTTECVNLITDSFNEVKKELQSQSPDQNSWLSSSYNNLSIGDPVVQHVAKRLQQLISFCGPRWVEVSDLTNAVSTAIDMLKKSKESEIAFTICEGFFNTISSLYDVWYDVHLMEELTEVLFAAAQLKPQERCVPKKLHNWTRLRNNKDLVDFGSLSINEKNFIISNTKAIRSANRNTENYKQESMRRTVAAARDLLQMSPSAIYIKSVQQTLLSKRDDLINDYIGKDTVLFNGPFCPLTKVEEGKKFTFMMTTQQLATLNGECSHLYSSMSLKMGMSRSASTAVRSNAITEFVASPTTSYKDVIELLEELSNDSSEDSLNNIMESIILTVFQTDSVWKVLAYLLSPEVIKKTPQRTTASIIVNFSKWVHTDKVVKVLTVLLVPSRRSAITLFLHKTILRLLADAGTVEAGELLRSEWTNRNTFDPPMHSDIVREIVKICVANVEENKRISQQAWEILSDVSSDDLNEDTSMLLLTHRWSPKIKFVTPVSFDFSVGHFSNPTPAMSESERAFVTLGRSLGTEPHTVFSDSKLCEKSLSTMQKLISNKCTSPALRIFAMFQAAQFSSMRIGELDIKTLDSLRQTILDPVSSFEEGEKYTKTAFSRLYSNYASQVVHKELHSDEYKLQESSIAQAAVGSSNPAAEHVRGTYETMLSTLLDTPPSNIVKYNHFSSSMNEIRIGLGCLYQHVIADPLKIKLSTLSTCKSFLSNVV